MPSILLACAVAEHAGTLKEYNNKPEIIISKPEDITTEINVCS